MDTATDIKAILSKAHSNYDSGRMTDASVLYRKAIRLMETAKIDKIGPYSLASIQQSQAIAECGARAEFARQRKIGPR